MKPLRSILIIAMTTLLAGCDKSPDGSNKINPILGDISFVKEFGIAPTTATDNNLRIKTHLAYVEELLREKDVSHLSGVLQRKRKHALDLLHTYHITGEFPKNYEHKDKRLPCFIDIKGTICAVGYLIEKTAGRALAEAINEKFKYSEILSMRDKRVDLWISESGLTKEECAMIQPGYNWQPDPMEPEVAPQTISTGYAITSSLSAGVNLSLSTVNAVQLSLGARSPVAGILSLGAGAGAIMLGALNLPGEGEQQNYRKQNLSIVNIGLGATNLVLGVCNLVSNRPKRRNVIVWNFYSFPEPGNRSGVGLSLTKKL